MILIAVTVVLVALPAWLLQHLRSVQNQHPFSEGQLNDLVCDLGLTKESTEILASRLGEHGILDSNTKIIFHHDRDNLLIRFFIMEDDFVHCNNIQGLLLEMGLP